jgi:uncharacterized protein (TIGR02246 family)
MKNITILSLAAMIGLGLSTSASAGSSPSIETELRQRLDAIETAWNARDVPGVARIYSDDVVATGEHNPNPAKGQQGMEALVSQLMEGTKSTKIDIYGTKKLGPKAAATWVTWTVVPADGSAQFQTKSLFIWEKEAGVWRISHDMFAMGPMSEN